MWKEFKAFLIKDNVIGLAIAVILGGVFGAVVKSIVDDVMMPIITMPVPDVKWQDLKYTLGNGSEIRYGNLIAALINLVIVGFVLWRMSKIFVKPPVPSPTAPTKVCQYCKSVVDATATRCPNCTSQL